ncbi:ABC transporter substrate-binding protein [Actinoplanes sp. NBRC 103695]|uniref:ABC transporter substrate-binding protein n=1 Tax=Actinoplanes sp. NBRC 103695 TaxID=3032202 RepID=UPI0024A1F7DE|nr:ABC transporter substrate-binding protein [Actinoplanes sp. NBRC 103695]GLZ00213.1 nitrate ABC transporter substrate-binding protein [Actinoplanes sp. NBRC 103695]
MVRAKIALVAAFALLTAACGGGGGAETTSDGTTKVTIGLIPIVDVAPVYLGIKKGFFAAEKLEITVQTAQGGAAIIPGVVSGQYQFGFSNTASLLLAGSQGLPLRVVAPGNSSTNEPGKDFGAVVVKKGSPIKSAKDLAGKRVAVNTLKNINTLTVSNAVREAGADPKSVTFVELPFPQIPEAIAKGDVDAGQLVEPFLTIVKERGDVPIVDNVTGLVVALYFTSEQFAAQNPKAVTGFTTAMKKSLDYANSHPEEARAVLSDYLKLEPAVQQKLVLPKWPSEIDRPAVQKLLDMAKTDGLITKDPDLAKLIP